MVSGSGKIASSKSHRQDLVAGRLTTVAHSARPGTAGVSGALSTSKMSISSLGEVDESMMGIYPALIVPGDLATRQSTLRLPGHSLVRRGMQLLKTDQYSVRHRSCRQKGHEVLCSFACKVDESLMIGDDIEVKILSLRRHRRIEWRAPRSVVILRESSLRWRRRTVLPQASPARMSIGYPACSEHSLS